MSLPTTISSFRALLPALRPEYRRMAASYLVGTASALALMVLGVLTAGAVGHTVVYRNLPGAWWWVTILALVLLRTVLTWQEMDVSHAVAYRVLARLRLALFDSYARSIPGVRREHSGRVAGVAMEDIEKLEFFYAHTLAQLATSITVFVLALAVMLGLLPAAGVIMAGGGVLVLATATIGHRMGRRLGEREQDLRSQLSAQVIDALGALREVLAYGLSARIVADALATTERGTAVSRRREMLTQFVVGVREAAVTVTLLGVILTAARATGAEGAGLSPALVPALVALALAGVSALSEMAATVTQLYPLAASAARVDEALRREPVVRARPRPLAVPAGPLGLSFRRVAFGYSAGVEVFPALTEEIRPGEHVGLVGPSGAGKSTLLTLAARLWEPSGGAIELVAASGERVPLAAVEEGALRRAVALVDQEATLFHGTVRENLLRGTAPVGDAALRQVLAQVGAAGWAELDAEVGQGGLRLSGGQQARLALARALVRRPRLLLVDEVTASLDPETEARIAQVLADYPGTVLVASHRAETLRRVRRIVVGANGGPVPPPSLNQ